MIDVVIPAHEKDIDTLDLCIDAIRANVKDVRRIIVVSKYKLTNNAEFFPETNYPFSFEDVADIVGWHRKTFNYFGALIQTTSALVIPDLKRDVLVCDSDTIFLKETEFVNQNDVALYNVSYDIPSHVIRHPYYEHLEKLIPGLDKQTKYSGICHHMLIQKDVLQDMFDRVEKIHNIPFWKANLMVTLEDYKSLNPKPPHGDAPLLLTTYELYFNYVMKYYPKRVSIRKQKAILSYKGALGYEGEDLQDVNSRTNLYDDAQILSPDLEKTFKFDSAKDAIINTINHIKKTEWEVVTFQNHQRIGSKTHHNKCREEISQILNRESDK